MRSEPRADMGKHPRRTRQLQTGQRGGLPALTLPDATSGRAAHAQTRARKMAHTDRPYIDSARQFAHKMLIAMRVMVLTVVAYGVNCKRYTRIQ